MRYCRNCGQETAWPRWCGACWAMVAKTVGILAVGALALDGAWHLVLAR